MVYVYDFLRFGPKSKLSTKAKSDTCLQGRLPSGAWVETFNHIRAHKGVQQKKNPHEEGSSRVNINFHALTKEPIRKCQSKQTQCQFYNTRFTFRSAFKQLPFVESSGDNTSSIQCFLSVGPAIRKVIQTSTSGSGPSPHRWDPKLKIKIEIFRGVGIRISFAFGIYLFCIQIHDMQLDAF